MEAATSRAVRVPLWVLGLVPLLLVIGGVALFFAFDGPGLGERRGPPAEARTLYSPIESTAP